MDSGYYAACAGLAAQVQALELIANNLSNLGTAGYRGQQATFRSILASRGDPQSPVNNAINNFGILGGSTVDLESGSLTATGNPLDLAVAGKGFFVVQSDSGGRLYTRNGGLHRATDGTLVNSEGDPVLGELGRVQLPNGVISVSGDGTISVDGAVAAKLHIAEFAPNTELQPAGKALYAAPPDSELPPVSSSVRQGMLEQSNVSEVTGLVQLISVQRNAEMMQRALSLFDTQLNQTAAQDLPRVQ